MMKASGVRKSRKKLNQLRGKLRQKEKNGPYYYRLMVANGVRKEFALKTADFEDAFRKATDLDAVYEAPNQEVAIAQINAIKGFSKIVEPLPLSEIWEKYEVHPDRARPLTPHEPLMYHSTLQEFIDYAEGRSGNGKGKRSALSVISDVTPEVVSRYVDYLKTTRIAVDTHNRKMRRLRKIFECLKDYCGGENPFRIKHIFRNAREEQGSIVQRQPFTKEQEQQLRDVLDDDKFQVMNKNEVKVIYYIGMYTGQRMKDCVLLRWTKVDLNIDRVWVKQFKTGKEVTIPIAPELKKALLEAQTWQESGNSYVCPKVAVRYNKINAEGKNVGNNLVNLDILRVIRWIGLEPSVEVPGRDKKMTVYGFHSLRHSFCSFCAEAGVPKAVVDSILGTNSKITDKYYTHIGDAAQRQAINAISGVIENDSLKDRVQAVIKLLDTKPEPTQSVLDQIRKILS
ncbi:MAG: phage integrase family protein [Lentisphaerae bacterium]|nr:phage integrase family protein [Lentisphaerota bacterium]